VTPADALQYLSTASTPGYVAAAVNQITMSSRTGGTWMHQWQAQKVHLASKFAPQKTTHGMCILQTCEQGGQLLIATDEYVV
jgi:hypothetical protein